MLKNKAPKSQSQNISLQTGTGESYFLQTRQNTLREFYLAIATLAAHEYFAFGCGSLFA